MKYITDGKKLFFKGIKQLFIELDHDFQKIICKNENFSKEIYFDQLLEFIKENKDQLFNKKKIKQFVL